MESGGGMVLGSSHVSETTRVRLLAPTKFFNSIFSTCTLYRIKTKSNTIICVQRFVQCLPSHVKQLLLK